MKLTLFKAILFQKLTNKVLLILLSIWGAIANPFPALAETKQINFLLNFQNINSLLPQLQQAESFIQKTIEQTFIQEVNISAILVTISGEHNGQIAPILSLNVSRRNWEVKQDILALTQNFISYKSLLGLSQQQLNQINSNLISIRSRREEDPGFRDD